MGGIGSGKSHIGCLDLIRRAKPWRLYMAAAPTFGMMRDSTLRSFLGLARELCFLRSMNLSNMVATLGNGAEVLFRSADDPERLRGPNLSGIYLDEASLMARAAYDISIGRLREQGERGWLGATFTPRGRLHWTYEVFAGGGPDVALIRARTADNPFLPPGFEAGVRGQYTSALAAQELGGEFVELAGALFRRAWFKMVDAAPAGLTLVRAWDLAGTERDPQKATDPDWTAGVLMGKSADNRYYILDVRRTRATAQAVEALVRQTAEEDGRAVPIWMEEEPGSSGKFVIEHFTRNVLAGWTFHGQKATGEKAERAQPFAAQAEAGNVHVLPGNWRKDVLDELETFPMGNHDDIVDAASLAFSKLALGPFRRLWVG